MKSCPTCSRTYADDIEFCPHDATRLHPAVNGTEAQLAAGRSRRYRIVRRLGQGGMGAVFLAEQLTVGNRPVALKVLSRKLLDDPDFLLRFQNEAASTGRIHHANVVTIYESAQADDGTPYIAMEFLEGESLRQALARRGALPVPEVAEILQQAARGLNAAHKLGIIHRDLKPDNIFLTYSDDESVAPVPPPPQTVTPASPPAQVGAGLVPALPVGNADSGRAQDPPLRPVVVKIVDFGIAKLRESGMHTQTGTVLGTPAYMSFEQASGMRSDELDARSDVYSLGVVVYEMLTGRTPFHSDTPVGYLRMHMQEAPPPFQAVKPDLPALPQLEGVVMKALTKDRDQRYSSVLEFAREFVKTAPFASESPAQAPSSYLPETSVALVTRAAVSDKQIRGESLAVPGKWVARFRFLVILAVVVPVGLWLWPFLKPYSVKQQGAPTVVTSALSQSGRAEKPTAPVELSVNQKLAKIRSDPDFWKLNPADQRGVWGSIDPEFRSLSPADQDGVIRTSHDIFRTGELEKVVNNPKFYDLEFSRQAGVLGELYPKWSTLGPVEQVNLVIRLQNKFKQNRERRETLRRQGYTPEQVQMLMTGPGPQYSDPRAKPNVTP